MKIFSLQSKTSLAAWSVVIGIIVGFFVSSLLSSSPCNKTNSAAQVQNQALQELTFQEDFCMHGGKDYGFPFKYSTTEYLSNGSLIILSSDDEVSAIVQNIIFWILVVFIILSLIRYFINRSRLNAGKTTQK